MPDSVYDQDVLIWSEQQADLLRRLAAGERVNDAVDWENVIEEVQDVGLSQLRACRSLLRQAIIHLLKAHAWPDSQANHHWLEEAAGFFIDARDAFAPSMRQRLPLDAIYADAAHLVHLARDSSGPPRPLPAACPYALSELLAKDIDLPALVGRLSAG